ncbi:hypothetical protein GCM10009772_50400 [Pseudonocardia alni subsp. carboxydivorans]
MGPSRPGSAVPNPPAPAGATTRPLPSDGWWVLGVRGPRRGGACRWEAGGSREVMYITLDGRIGPVSPNRATVSIKPSVRV